MPRRPARGAVLAAFAATAVVAGLAHGNGMEAPGVGQGFCWNTTPTVTSCGTSPTLASNSTNCSGTITVGASAGTSCTLNFDQSGNGGSWTPLRNACVITFVELNGKGNIPIWIHSQSASAVVINASSDLGANGINYRCSPGPTDGY